MCVPLELKAQRECKNPRRLGEEDLIRTGLAHDAGRIQLRS
jgi:hypothetical protein